MSFRRSLTPLSAVACLVRTLDRHPPGWPVAAGLAGGFVALTGVYLRASATAEIGVAVVVGAALALGARARRREPASDQQKSRPRLSNACSAATLALLAVCVVLGRSATVPPQSYFMLASVTAAVIALQTLVAPLPRHRGLILAEIVLLAVLLRAVLLFSFPSLYGTDTWGHAGAIDDWREAGHILRTGPHGEGFYYSFPVTYLQTIAVQLVSSTDIRLSMFLAMSVPLVFVALVVFSIGRTLAGERAGLLAALSTSFSQFLVVWGAFTIPTVVGIVLFSCVMLQAAKREHDRGRTVVLLLLSCALVWTHTISAFVTAIALLVFAVGLYVTPRLRPLASESSNSFVLVAALLFSALMLMRWLYAYYPDEPFFERTFRPFWYALRMDATLVGSPFEPAPTMWNRLSFLMLIVFATWGAVAWLQPPHRTGARASWVAATVALAAAMFGFTFMGINSLIPQRWLAFAFVMTTPMVGMALLSQPDGGPMPTGRALLAVAVVGSWAWFSVNTNFVNLDTPFYTTNVRLPYTASEQAAANTALVLSESPILADKTMSDEYFAYAAREKAVLPIVLPEHGIPPRSIAVVRDYARLHAVAAQVELSAINADLVGRMPRVYATSDAVLAVYDRSSDQASEMA